MSLHPILSSLRKHRVAAGLIVLEIAFSCAVVCNALFLIDQRLERMQRPSGAAEQELVQLRSRSVVSDGNSAAQTRADLDALRRIPGVREASIINQPLFGDSLGYSGVSLRPGQERSTLHAVQYFGDARLLDTLGLHLVAGRRFADDEFIDDAQLRDPVAKRIPPSVILSQSLAQRLFPGQNAVGRTIYVYGEHRIVGVVQRLVQPREGGNVGHYEDTMLFPVNVPYDRGTYLLRVRDPAQREAVLRQAKATLSQHGPRRMVNGGKTLQQARADYYRDDQAMAWLLVGVCVLLLLVTALGIVGLTSFWVQQRTKQIGIRRALGATCTQILRHFQLENFLLASTGIVLGMLLAYAANLYLMSAYELPRLPLWYLPVGAVVLWLLGQLAVLPPARRAAAVPPAVATRSV
ncbi:ABC transporter permease [Xanthomonas sontii]|uniref:ABC transporter permease n=1 Tax=Xanthomonas sontii TaxID=2650745 RepID=UPI0011E4B6E8|nr:FtsX-like permease family protein [Xanthomonas sontii]MDQ7760884.1 ABC transporter permease [Xanthomonas sontii]TYD32878.1 ABC transporter permease [Xanthomonas sontii]UZK08548.1 FtsX-like permease family protein [Xanthomonas sontii]